MALGLVKASAFAIKKEVTAGVYVKPTVGADFIPLRPGNSTAYEPELLESDELLNDIGATKSATGKQANSGSHPAYLRHSGVEGQEPEVGVLYESVFGSKAIMSTEYDTISGSTVSILNVDTGEGANFVVGQAILIKDGSNGFSIRNVASINVDALTLNFDLSDAPAPGVDLGKAVSYIPVATGHPTFSATKYIGGDFAIEATAGNTVTEMALTAEANGYGTVEFSYEGTKYYFNPIEITSSTRFLDFTDDTGTYAVSVPVKVYETPIELADALEQSIAQVTVEVFTVKYDNKTGKFTIASSTSALVSLLWNSGTNTANTIGTKLGFSVAADDTSATTYTSDNAQSYASGITPAYDAGDAIIIKGAELFVGGQQDNVCICAQSVAITVSKTVEDVDCICEETGVSEKIPTARTMEMQITASLNKYDASVLDALLKNKGISAMLNAGPKVGGNWKAGSCANFYLQNSTVSAYTVTGENFVQAEFTLRGYVTSTSKDGFLNFV